MPSFSTLHLQQRVLVAISRVQGSDSQIQKFHSSHWSCRVHSTPHCLLADLKWSLRPSLEANRSLKEARERERKRKEWRLQPQKESALLVTAKVREGSLEVRCNPVCKDTLGSICLYFDSRNPFPPKSPAIYWQPSLRLIISLTATRVFASSRNTSRRKEGENNKEGVSTVVVGNGAVIVICTRARAPRGPLSDSLTAVRPSAVPP